MKPTRRELLAGAAALAAARPAAAQILPARRRAVVVGAGVFGVWTAIKLLEAGLHVSLFEAWDPAHSRASSGGETRMTRAVYGADEIYSRMALRSLPEWQALSQRESAPLFHETGVLFLFGERHPYAVASMEVHQRLGLPTQMLDQATLGRRYPMMDFSDIEFGLLEQDFGVLMARRAVQALVRQFSAAGGYYYPYEPVAPPDPDADRLTIVRTPRGTSGADHFVFACGPWLPRLFPDLLARRIRPTRQEVFFFRPPSGELLFRAGRPPGHLPGWADFNGGDLYYGMPDIEGRGFKIARDTHGPEMDPDTGDRAHSAEALARVRAYMARRFPALADAPLNESRVCQYENSANGDFLIDRHPRWSNVVLVGAGSGHGFKMGPAVGAYAAALATGAPLTIEPRFSLASKAESGERLVH